MPYKVALPHTGDILTVRADQKSWLVERNIPVNCAIHYFWDGVMCATAESKLRVELTKIRQGLNEEIMALGALTELDLDNPNHLREIQRKVRTIHLKWQPNNAPLEATQQLRLKRQRVFFFNNADDAMLFKLTFGGT